MTPLKIMKKIVLKLNFEKKIKKKWFVKVQRISNF